MNIVGYDPTSYTEGPGIRVAVWVSGCPHKCPGCFNQKYWSQDKGTLFTEKHLDKILRDLDNYSINGISFLGGEPLAPYNVEGILSVMREIRKKFGDKKTILVYTGYVLEELPIWVRAQVECLADMIIDGRYEKDLPTKKPFRGSDNQSFYVKKDGIWHKVD